ncbi:MAG TPA: hypothetical protein VLA49_07230 [Anaerolineales bacterium]|nr:hypothetical protein [Anaerolineales bacterium]
MKPPAERPKFPCALVILIIITAFLIVFLVQSYGGSLPSVLVPAGQNSSSGPIEQVVGSLRGLGQGLVNIFNNILP